MFVTFALFINPFGYDWVVYGIMQLTHDYWTTMIIMYLMAGFFFGLSMYLYYINPLKFISSKIKKTCDNIKRKISKNGQNI